MMISLILSCFFKNHGVKLNRRRVQRTLCLIVLKKNRVMFGKEQNYNFQVKQLVVLRISFLEQQDLMLTMIMIQLLKTSQSNEKQYTIDGHGDGMTYVKIILYNINLRFKQYQRNHHNLQIRLVYILIHSTLIC
jgi:hypothetical protein